MSEYISISESVALTGKSISTIRRVVKRLATEGATDSIRMEGDKYLIRRDVLFRELGLEGVDSQAPTQATSQMDSQEQDVNSHDHPVTIHEKMVEVLQEQLRSQAEQLKAKDTQIASLLERLREQNALAASYRNRLLTVAPEREEPPASKLEGWSLYGFIAGVGLIVLMVVYLVSVTLR